MCNSSSIPNMIHYTLTLYDDKENAVYLYFLAENVVKESDLDGSYKVWFIFYIDKYDYVH